MSRRIDGLEKVASSVAVRRWKTTDTYEVEGFDGGRNEGRRWG